MGNYPRRAMNQKLANRMKMWNENGNTTTLLFSLKFLHQQKRRGQVKEKLESGSVKLLESKAV